MIKEKYLPNLFLFEFIVELKFYCKSFIDFDECIE